MYKQIIVKLCVYCKCRGYSHQPLYFTLGYYAILSKNQTLVL